MRRAWAVASVLAVSLLWPTGGARAEPPDVIGWWSRTQLGPLFPPTPSTVPEGGLYVGGEPTGPLGVSALRFEVPSGAHLGDMVLEVDNAQGSPEVQVCVIELIWAPEEGGPFDSAPASSCEAGLAFAAVDDDFLRVPVGALVRDGLLNVRLEPEPGSVFQVAFAPPGPDAIEVFGGPPPEEDFGEFEFFDPTVALGTPVASGPFDPGAELFGTQPPTEHDSLGAPATGPSIPQAARPAGPVSDVSGRERFVAAAILLNLLLAYLVLVRRDAPQAAAAGAPGERGIGRFRQTRTGSPPRL